MNLSATGRKKLEKLIPRLASDQDGEVVATVRAIQKALTSDNCDFHDLAKLQSGEVVVEYREKVVYRDRKTHTADDSWGRKAKYCRMHLKLISGNSEKLFIKSMASRAQINGYDPTEKQLRWLNDIYLRTKEKRNT